MKKIVLFVIFVLSFFNVYSQSTQTPKTSWKALEMATRSLDEDDPGSALRYAEIAKELRKQEYQNKINILESAIIPLPVQQVGDVISDVLYILEQRNSYDAVNLINELLNEKGEDFFDNSITNMQSYLEKLLEYPEADYLIGKVYLYEGEYAISEEYYKKALNKSDILDIPDTQFDIRYDLAHLAKIQMNDKLYEESLLSILEQSNYYSSKSENYGYSKAALRAATDSKLAEKYFLLYRVNSTKFIPAYLKIADFYKDYNYDDKAFYSITLGVLSAFTRINDIVSMRNYEYTYSNLDTFFSNAIKYSDINDWMLENDIWQGFLLFADYVSNSGNTTLANEIYDCLKKYCPILSIQKIVKY